MKTILCAVFSTVILVAQTAPRDYPVRPVPFTAVHVDDQFWAPKIETNRKVTIPFAFGKDEETGRIDNFIRAAKALHGESFENHKYPPYPFDDTDVYKVIEGASYALSVHPDPKLETYVDGLIAKIGAAQEPDGYLYTARTIDPQHPHPWSGPERWTMEGVNSHELYDLGHLYEAAVAYYDATGKRSLLDIALRTANLLDQTFGPGKRVIWPGHQIIEMGLAKLYRTTDDPRYLNLAKFMLDSRGPQSSERGAGNRYVEAHLKVTQQTEAVAGGHAVRAMYMYSGMADVAALTGDREYVGALDKIWENVAYKKLHVTGGVGARAAGESFGENYELPNMSAYNETCAAVAATSTLTGRPALKMSFGEMSFINEFDGIWACASLLHVPRSMLPAVLSRLERALKRAGHLYMSFKYGATERIESGRFFNDLNENLLRGSVRQCSSLYILSMWTSDDARPNRPITWLNAIAQQGGSIMVK